jgi:tetratricopeptide (TPR) repeat protein
MASARNNTPVHRYYRADVLRILRITGQQLAQWQKAGLVAAEDAFSFFDLIQLKKIRDLRAKRVPSAVIRESLEAMQRQVAGMENPLLESGTYTSRRRIVFRHEGHAVEPIAGQFELDFAPGQRVVPATVKSLPVAETAHELFVRGVSLEDDPASQEEAIATYRKVIELEPRHAASHINLGTLFYHRGQYSLAEAHYRNAIEVDPRYALAYFDLGNVLDETARLEQAIEAYRTALSLAPTYADAHYNLALAYEKTRNPRKALNHWRAYLKLDANGPWSGYARTQVRKILHADKLKVIYRRQR